MPRTLKFLTPLIALLLAQGCAREKSFDIEPLATGGYIIRASASTWREPVGAANIRATQDAEKFCRREGRAAKIKEAKPNATPGFVMEAAEVEFDCVLSAPLRAAR